MNRIYWDNRIDRLRRSGRVDLANSYYIGDRLADGLHYLVSTDRSLWHWHIMGGTRSGKSALVRGLACQALAADASVVHIQMKPDPLSIESAKIDCYNESRLFRCLNIQPGERTHLFPFRQPFFQSKSFMAQAETIIQALGLDAGGDANGAFYTAMDEKLQYAGLLLRPEDVTPAQMASRYGDQKNFRPIVTDSEWVHTSMSRSLIMKLATVTALNAGAGSPGVTQKVLDYAVDLRQLFDAPQMFYVALDLRGQRATSRALAGYIAYCLMEARSSIRHKPPVKRVMCIIDDCQEVICGPHVEVMIDTSASLGIELVLLHQNLSQLHRGRYDLRTSLAESTGVNVVFSPTAEETRKFISATSGTRVGHELSWPQEVSPWFDPSDESAFSPSNATGGLFDTPPTVNVKQNVVANWTESQIKDISAIPQVAWVRQKFDEALVHYQSDWTPVFVPYHITKEEKGYREQFPTPDTADETIPVELSNDFERSLLPKPSPPPKPQPKNVFEHRREQREKK